MSDFSDRPFIAGTIVGLRSFRVTPNNMLTACTGTGEQWQPGVNVAECRPRNAFAAGGITARQFANSIRRLSAAVKGQPEPEPLPEPPAHRVAQVECTCGWYAYFDTESNPHHEPGNALGLIEGFGTVTIGARGFRAEKARLLALIDPNAISYEEGFGTIPDCACWLCSGNRALIAAWAEQLRCDSAAISANYRDVPVFATLEAAVAEFPLTPVDVPKPVRPKGIHTGRSGGYVWVGYTAAPIVPTKAERDEPAKDETPQARALRLKRERNTGPALPRLDGRKAQR